jgi:hypothetical protein
VHRSPPRSSRLRETRLPTSLRRRRTRSPRHARPSASFPTRGPPRAGHVSQSGRRSTRHDSPRDSTNRRDGHATTTARSRAAFHAANRSPTRGTTGRSSPHRRARGRHPPAWLRGSRRSRRCRSAPGCGRRPIVRRRCAAAPSSGTARAAPVRPVLRPGGRRHRPRRRSRA